MDESDDLVNSVDWSSVDLLKDRVGEQQVDLERSGRVRDRVQVDHDNAYLSERQLYWRDTIATSAKAQGGGVQTEAGPAAGADVDGPVIHESRTGGPDVVVGVEVQAQAVNVSDRRSIPARGPSAPSKQPNAQQAVALRAQQQRHHHQPGQGFGR